MKTYKSYSATPNGWYKTDSPKSPMRWLPSEFIYAQEAMSLGFRPAKRNDSGEFIPVVSCTVKGFRGTSSRAYVSRWVKPTEPRYANPQPNDGPARLALLLPRVGNRKIK